MKPVKPSELTKENYYDNLAYVNNHVAPCVDIMTITGFMDWEERIAHYTRYYNELVKAK